MGSSLLGCKTVLSIALLQQSQMIHIIVSSTLVSYLRFCAMPSRVLFIRARLQDTLEQEVERIEQRCDWKREE